jgi:F-type H+-transporting ATPase subunit epsilon
MRGAAGVISVEVVSFEGVVWAGTSTQVVVPGVLGDFAVLRGHQPIVSLLRAGDIRITRHDGTRLNVPVESGFVFVQEGAEVVILTDAPAELETFGAADGTQRRSPEADAALDTPVRDVLIPAP